MQVYAGNTGRKLAREEASARSLSSSDTTSRRTPSASRTRARTLAGSVFTADDAHGVDVARLSEQGRSRSTPSPLIRVRLSVVWQVRDRTRRRWTRTCTAARSPRTAGKPLPEVVTSRVRRGGEPGTDLRLPREGHSAWFRRLRVRGGWMHLLPAPRPARLRANAAQPVRAGVSDDQTRPDQIR